MDAGRTRGLLSSRGVRAACALALCVLAACSGGAPRNPIRGAMEVDDGDERSVGAQVDAAIREQVPLIDDPIVLGFTQDLGQRVVAVIEPQPFIYRFRVIEDPNLNAFALPGGYVYLHSATILQAGSLSELAGVVGHEVAHVKARHYARGTEQAFWPSLLTTAAGLAAAFATGEPGFAVAAQGVNVALQLKYSREFENEADDLGAAFVARAGFDPSGMGRFFERILAANRPAGIHVPPYLYSHPDVEDRIDAVRARAESLGNPGPPPPALEAAFRDAQARLALLVATGRTRWAQTAAFDRSRTDPLLAAAERARGAGDTAQALARLEEAERSEPLDPRPSFLRGEILLEAGRDREAIPPLRRALALDPSVALAWYRLGTAHQRLGHRHTAVYCFEQAERRFTTGGSFRERALLAIATLSDPPVVAAGLSAGALPAAEAPDDTGASGPGPFTPADGAIVWWARLDRRYAPLLSRIRVRWIDPHGETVHESAAEPAPRRRATASLPLEAPWADRYGIWRVEASLDGQVVDRHAFHYVPPAPPSSSRR